MSTASLEVVEALRATLKERDQLLKENTWLRASANEPIAILGMACRYPGAASSPEELFQMALEGRDGISPFPADRGWDLERLYDPDPDNLGTSYAREGGFLDDAADFDAEFFGIAPREALAMDPQQRLLLEACWQALEDAGIDPASLQGEQAGVFAGVMSQSVGSGLGDLSDDLLGYIGTGSSTSIVSGRVAYALGLEGPAMTIDTACSSSLVAMHLAAGALRSGECNLALVGGVTVLGTPVVFLEFSRQRGLAPDGRCKSFAEAADGAGFSEGVGVLALERLSDAQRNGHPILAVLKGSAVNQDGASNGLTAPNGPSQERVIRQALANAGLKPQDVDAVEAHGTGTTLGDPIEAGALLATYGQDREQPLKLGSIKSNIGHTQAAAGVAGVIKMVGAMRHGVLPKTLHVDAPSSKVDWSAGEIELLTEQAEWQPNGHPRRAGVSSFGISGTNAHVILEEAPASAQPSSNGEQGGGGSAPERVPLPGPIPLALSAKSEPALREAAARLAAHLKEDPELDLTDVAYSLTTTRTSFEQRAVALGESREELLGALASIAEGLPSPNVHSAKAKSSKLAYLLSGQGSQRPGMGRELYETDPDFKAAFEAACEALDPLLGESLEEIVFATGKGAKERLKDTAYAQPALFAIELALYRALEAKGLIPDILAGHSIGEITAAHVAGVFDLKDAAKLVAARGALMGALPKGGAMLATQITEKEAAAYLSGKEAELSIAAINGPTAIVLSGTEAAIEEASDHFEAKGRKTKPLEVSHAFHSPLIEPMAADFEALAKTLRYHPPQIPIVSTQSGELLGPEQATDPAYWVSQARQPVRFAAAVATLSERGATIFCELGPDPVLLGMAESCLAQADDSAAHTLTPTLREGRPEGAALSAALAQAHAAGAKLDWGAFFKGSGARRVPLPTYPFQRERYWLNSTMGAGDVSAAGLGDPDHPLLSATIEDPEGEGLTLTGRISLQSHPWLADYAVSSTVLLPATAFLELALKAAELCGAEQVAELTLQAPLLLPESGAVQLQVTLAGPDEQGNRDISIHSRLQGAEEEEEHQWSTHANGTLTSEAKPQPEPLGTWPPENAEPLALDDFYEHLADAGLNYGEAFQGLTSAWMAGEEIFAEVSLADAEREEAGRFAIHPALLDAALHASALSVLVNSEGEESQIGLPFSWSEVGIHVVGAQALRVRLRLEGEAISLDLYDQSGEALARVADLRTRPLDPAKLQGSAGPNDLLAIEWRELAAAEPVSFALLGEPAEIEALGEEAPEVLLWSPKPSSSGAQGARQSAEAALEVLQMWLAKAPPKSRLAILSEKAVASDPSEPTDPATASVWGLLRSAQAEHPGRFVLIDTDGSEASLESLPKALGLAEEPQLALREGKALVPRLARMSAPPPELEGQAPIDPEQMVLITGATGGLGSLIAAHLAEAHGARHLLLASRSGKEAEGATELQAKLTELGAKATIAACDVSDPKQLQTLIDGIPGEHPLGAVIHAAGALADGLIDSMDAEQLERVFAPKAEAAQHLHELTRDLDLSAFVMFSSAAGVLGGPGQGNYAAANSFLDALAQKRRSEGLPATSIAWGLWQRESAMTSGLGQADRDRMARVGIGALSDERGLELFDAAIATERALTLALALDPKGLRAQAKAGILPPILAGLVRIPTRRKAPSGSLAKKLAGLGPQESEAAVLELVLSEVAAVLGHDSPAAIDPERAFKEMGFDSLAAVELRNRLNAASGLNLAATAVFDYPSPQKLAGYLLREASDTAAAKQIVLRATASDEPIAILGMACRYPGAATSPEELFQLALEGRDGISPFPADRGWDLERLYDPDPSNLGTSYAREGGFLDDAADFDAEFFGIAPREALAMDPQQRLLLEACWQALEDAGIDPASLRGEQAGVFAGAGSPDYGPVPGLTSSIVSGRVAYALGLEGPAMTIDTACSSSLVAMHLASQALRSGECSLALVGGVTVLGTPTAFMEFSRQRGLAPDGRCKSFAEAADGVGWGEGVGVLALQRLSEAEKSDRPILAVLKGSAVNQDGASNGLTAPNGPSQERVIRQALANAGLKPQDVDAVEAHGTGTTLGDPIEAGALLATYGQDREQPLKLGSIKSNIGHTISAAGVAGVIKMVGAMRHGVLPKTLHVDAPSSKVDWSAGEIELLTEEAEWRPNGHPRRAGVSSFGISGTNAHVILEEAPASAQPSSNGEGGEGSSPERVSLPGPIPLALSAKTEPALREAAARLSAHLKEDPELDLTDVAYSLTTTRTSFEQRAVALGESREELLGALGALAEGTPSTNVHSAKAKSSKLAYLFSGQGSQRPGMGRELYETDPDFKAAFEAACEALDPLLGESLEEIVFATGKGAKERLKDTAYAQPALFAIELALYRSLEAKGLIPDILAGHSIGEITAAHIAGVFDLKDAAKLVAARGALMGALPKGGAMLATQITEKEAAAYLKGKEAELSIAAINGPTAIVLSGTEAAVSQAQEHFGAKGRKTKPLEVSHAFHSPLIEPMLEEFEALAKTLRYHPPQIPIVSTQSGELLGPEQATDPAYWVSQARQPVRFAAAVATLSERGATIFCELGPDPVLLGMAESCLAQADDSAAHTLTPTLREGRPEGAALSAALAQAHAAGAKLDWGAFFKGSGARRVPLPTYPFQRERYWLSSDALGFLTDPTAIGQSAADHPLLSATIEDPEGEGLTLTGRISLQSHPWLADHAVFDTVLLPGTAFLELALKAAELCGAEQVAELTLQAPLVLPESGAVQLQVTVSGPDEQGNRDISIHSRPQGEEQEPAPAWVAHATGFLSAEAKAPTESPQPWPPQSAEPIQIDDLYASLADLGLQYGPAFQGLSAAWSDGTEIFAEVSLADAEREEAGRFAIHPALLDAALHAAALSALVHSESTEPQIGLPFSWSEVDLHTAGAQELRVSLRPEGDSIAIAIADQDGAPLARVGSLRTRPISAEQMGSAKRRSEALLGIEWEGVEIPAPSPEDSPKHVATLGELRLSGAERHRDPAALAAARAAGAPVPEVVVFEPTLDPRSDSAESALSAAVSVLELLQRWLQTESLATSRLVLLSHGAIAAAAGESPDPNAASLWGLLRSAQAEHPGRFSLIDTDGSEASLESLPAALGLAEEPQLALREGKVLVPRLARLLRADQVEPQTLLADPERTVLITGATGGLGSLIAAHMVKAHGARHLLLASRSGKEAEGAEELQAKLTELGCEATIAACDVSDPKQLGELIDGVPKEHPLGAVIHAAGTLADGLIDSLGKEQLERVFAPKAEAAQHLHELTKDLDLSAFVMFSSAAGVLGGPGQGNYAAANSFLDALAQKRKSEGLAATSIAWGLWQRESAMTAKLGEADLARMERAGIEALSDERGLELFDAALGAERDLAIAIGVNPRGLRAMAGAGLLAPIFSNLVQVPKSTPRAAGGSLATRLRNVPEDEREGLVLELVRGEVAGVLGHPSPQAIDPERAFKEMGFDSLAAVELRNRLNAASGLNLAATAVFDYPSPQKLAGYLLREASDTAAAKQIVLRATASDEPIAILGMACRYPGAASSPEELFQMALEGRDGISPFPADRGWDLERLYDPDPDNLGTSYAREGGFLDDAADFDAEFFGIAPREALAMDPQQRLLLEACWQALEDAGIDPVSLRGEQAGVFAGVMYQDYGPVAGMSSSIVSGRVAYALGLEGPAITVDTACSSSLVAMHLASQALRSGECSLALVGGVTVLGTPTAFMEFSRQRGLAPDGRCKSFAEAADGVGWSEGVGVLALQRLSEAEKSDRPILAVLKGSAVNQDGASNGLTAPNGPSQERVIRQALANAGLKPQDVDAVEAHGTGTTLGDPIEAGALLATYGQERENGPLRLGSIKSNIGHTQAAAGVAGVIKMVGAMRHGVLPKTLHVDAPSSKVDWSAGEIELLTEEAEWQPNGHPRRAGVSSFGISGTNAHVILEEAPASLDSSPQEQGGEGSSPERVSLPGPIPLALSAKSEPALREAAARLIAHLEEDPELDLTDVAYSLTTTRTSFEQRAVALGESREELLEALGALAEGLPSANVHSAKAKSSKLAYLLSGQGSQRPGMGRELYETDPDFKAAFEAACEALDPLLGESLEEIVFAAGKGAKERLKDTAYAQPALFAIELALYRALEAKGLIPDILAGHSIGEITAAHIAGVFDLKDAAKLVAARGALMGALPKGGAMLATQIAEKEAAAYLSGKEAELSIAAINGPTAIVLSGTEAAIEEASDHFEAKGKKTKPLEVSHAFHSPLIEPMAADFEALAKTLAYHPPQIPIVSTQSGELLGPEQATDPAYWAAQARQPVRFAAAVATLSERGATIFCELGPDPVLLGMAESCLTQAEDSPAHTLAPTLREGRPEGASLITALAQAHAAGAKLDWEAFFKGSGAKRVPLPTYPFQRERYWLSSDALGFLTDPTAIGQSATDHPLLSATIEDPEGEGLTLTGRISLQSHPWLADHAVFGTVLLPGTAFLELALKAAELCGAEQVGELTLQAPLVLPESGAVQMQVTVSGPDEKGNREISIHSRLQGDEQEPAPAWIAHATGFLSAEAKAPTESPQPWPPQSAEPIQIDDLYASLADLGLQYGPAFQGLGAAWSDGTEIFAEVSLADAEREEAGRFAIHPALLDSALHAAALSALGHSEGEEPQIGLPFAWSEVGLHAAGAQELRVSLRPEGDSIAIDIADQDGAPLARVGSLRTRPISAEQMGSAKHRSEALLGIEWEGVEIPAPSPEDPPKHIATVGELALPGAERHQDLAALIAAIADGAPAPEAVVFEPTLNPRSLLASVEAALETLQQWLQTESLATSRLVLLSHGAIAAAAGESPDPNAASLWGLLRSAQAEHPGRFSLIDTDGSEASLESLPAALGLAEEPQLALREGKVLVPRLARLLRADQVEPQTLLADPERTVLITGATGGLGSLIAAHMVKAHGARHLLLASRSGKEAEGAEELQAKLTELGCEATIAACDVSDPKQLGELIDGVPKEHPLGAVIHAAGTLADGLIDSLGKEQLERVFAPKAEAAQHLHELTKDLDLSAFVMFSSAAGVLGGPGQGNYAAANSFLDALAQKRKSEGLAATSIAWGLWQRESAMTAKLGEADLARMERAGIEALSDERGLELFDAALGAERDLAIAIGVNPRGLRAMAGAGLLAPIFSNLVQVPKSTPRAAGGSLATRLRNVPEDEREGLVLELVRGEVAGVLGHPSPQAIDPERAFKEMGFDSLAAIELRNRLGQLTDLKLPSTAVFDYPNSAKLAGYLLGEAATSGVSAMAPLDDPFGLTSGEAAGGSGMTVQALLSQAARRGSAPEFFQLLGATASFRPSFEEQPEGPAPVPLASGTAEPVLVCLATAVYVSGAHEYTDIAKEFEGVQDVMAVPQSGFGPGELVPASFPVAVDAHAEAVGKLVGSRSFVLVGHSTGGHYAHAVARQLQERGPSPAAVVAIDSYEMDFNERSQPILDVFLSDINANWPVSATRLTAMGAHFRLLAEWSRGEISAPTLLLRASESLPGTPSDLGRNDPFKSSHQIDVPGNHFTMMNQHADTTAQAIKTWLADISAREAAETAS